jgi:hypothetical protein
MTGRDTLSSLSPFTGREWSEQSEDRVRGQQLPLIRLAASPLTTFSPRAGRRKGEE